MSYLVVCTFDLADASREDYETAYADLDKIGLHGKLRSDNSKDLVLPTTTTAGKFSGQSAAAVRDDITGKVKRAFAARGFKSEIFISVGGDWAWSHRTT